MDSDGDLDIITAFYNEPTTTGTGKLIWYENDGSQNYTQHNVDTAINGALYLTAADVNGDNKIDILLSAYDGNALYAFINNGGTPNTFLPKITIDGTAVGSNYVSANDFDGDSVMDAVSANYGGNELAWYKYTPPLTITKNIIDSAATLVSSVETGDMDGDLDMDLVVTANNEVLWYENDGTGAFTKHTIPASAGFTGSITAYMFDFDLDGDMDIIASASIADEVAWFENDGSQVFTKHIVATGVDYASYVKPVDFNNDGNIDIVVSATNANELLWFENDGTDLVFTQHLVGNGNSLGDAYGLDVADIDGDGDVDIALTSPGPNIFRWLENDFIGPPANDLCINAFPVTCGNNYAGSTSDATETDEETVTCGTTQGAPGVWFKYIGDDNKITLDLCGSDYDTKIQVWSGSCGTLTCVGGNDDAPNTHCTIDLNQSLYEFDADAGVDYYIYVYGYSSIIGNYDLAVSCTPYPDCPDVLNISASNFSGTNADLSWDVSVGAAGYNWEIQPQGAAQGDGTLVELGSVTTNSALATMLIDATDYTLYVQSDCSSSMLGNWFSYDFTFNLPPANDDCLTATVVTCSDILAGETTDFSTDNGDDLSTHGGMGNGVWYKYIGDDQTITIDISNQSVDMEVGVAASVDCVTFTGANSSDSAGSSSTESITFDADAGTTYFIYVAYYGDTSTITGTFDLAVSCVPYPDCPDVLNITVGNFTSPGNADLSWDVSAGATGYNWEIQPQGVAQGDGTLVESGSVTTNSALATMLMDGTDYTLYVQSDCNSSMLGNWFSYDFTFILPPANDDCLGAILLLEQNNMIDYASTTPYAGTILGATNSGLVATTCDEFTGTANDDVWFKFVATTSALHITLEDDFDGVMNLFDGDCTTLNLLDCADSGANPQIDATSLTVGNTYYLRVYNYYISTTSTPNFNISVWTESTASITELSSVGFEYYPNPVNSNLTVKANENITSITIFNMLGQQVKQVNPSSLNTQIDMTNLANGTYFIKATVGERVGTFKIVKK